MNFKIRGDKLEVTEAIKLYVEEKLGKLDKYFSNPDSMTANVLLKVKSYNQTVEVTIVSNGVTLRGEDSNKDLYAAIDLVVEKIERQIRKNKTRIKKKNKGSTIGFNVDFEELNDVEEEKIVKRKTVDTKPMDEEEAILQMNLLGHEFFIFKDVESEKMCVLYKRKDGDYGIIEIN